MFNKTVSFVFMLISLAVLTCSNSTPQKESIRSRLVNFKIELTTVRSGYNHTDFWELPFAGAIPNAGENGQPAVVLTTQKHNVSKSDVYYALNEMRTDDLGRTWSGPIEHAATLGRRKEPDGSIVCICDFTSKWHKASGKLLGTGHVAYYSKTEELIANPPRQTAYSVYDAEKRTWDPWTTLDMSDKKKFFNSGSGCSHRVDLPDGTILLPVYYYVPTADGREIYAITVTHCSFYGSKLTYLEHGDEMSVPEPRGLCEGSLTFYNGNYYITMRNDLRGYVATSKDGLHFEPFKPWTFDDGTDLGSYNTQQHWVTHSDGLFLVYTRKGANNDHVFRHRAPLFIAQVDPERLCVIRETEKILVPNRGAGLGNFGVTEVNENETWVTVAECMLPEGNERYGSDNSVYAAKILWEIQNKRALQY